MRRAWLFGLGMLVPVAALGSCGEQGGDASSSRGSGGGTGTGGADAGVDASGDSEGGGGFDTPPCADDSDGSVDGGFGSCAMAAPGLTFDTDIAPIVVKSCTGELCHFAPTYVDLVDVVAYQCCGTHMIVAPGDPGHSYLMNKITDVDLCYGGPMPLDQPLLPDAQIKTIHDWICDGAKEH